LLPGRLLKRIAGVHHAEHESHQDGLDHYTLLVDHPVTCGMLISTCEASQQAQHHKQSLIIIMLPNQAIASTP
jgi:hypothetical protein